MMVRKKTRSHALRVFLFLPGATKVATATSYAQLSRESNFSAVSLARALRVVQSVENVPHHLPCTLK